MSAGDALEILSRLRGMQEATLGRCLADGPTNTTYLVQRGCERFVLRLDKGATRSLGLDRANERAVCATLASAGLTPGYLHFDVVGGVCLRPYVAGRTVDPADLKNPGFLGRLAEVLRRLHALAVVGGPFDATAAAGRYAEKLSSPQARALAERVAATAQAIRQYGAAPVLCHNDLVAENMLETAERGLLLIDWEYAGVGDPLFDLAVVARHHGLAEGLAEEFLAAYLQRAPSAPESERFGLQCDLYDALLELWTLRVNL
jgi:thiamine kinase-like enzyme